MPSSFSPPLLAYTTELDATLQVQGYAVLNASQVVELSATALPRLLDWCPHWNDLPADAYLRDGGRYRRRRHSCFVVRGEQLEQVPHRAHWQPLAYNALHGGLERHFEPMQPALLAQAEWRQLLVWLGRVCSQRMGQQPWFIEAHQFRIDTTDGIGRPTPEGAHRDGVDMVAVFLVARHGVKGGETRVFEADGPNGQRFTLCEPWSVLLLDDARVIHESTPIQPLDPLGPPGYRDTLVITLRTGGFQAEA
ncbi:MAG: 2OG-Fe dioxygenase family protein [Rhodoferax sp.]|nr:2OG-Fe dioxygenase family protein [Rhodoferax sp.]